ncbi:MAG: PIN domain-containing protein [Deltaproteobacteria bacterium]|nr:PIN domain-containing protein [Deltaproteobacteria bacterium]
MNLLLDTHFVIWIVLGSRRLVEYPWLERYRPWGISPVSLLEIQYLAEVGRLEAQNPELTDALLTDPRFVVDELPLLALIKNAIPVQWTRDPFDRLLAAHSRARRVALCSVDRGIREHHSLVAEELRG